MSNRREELEQQIAARHEMHQTGQVWQFEACGVKGADECKICGLRHEWASGGQNTGGYSRWSRGGDELSLRDAAALEC